MTSQTAFKKVVYPYVKSDDAFNDPVTNKPFELNVWLSKKSLAAIDSPSEMIAICSAPHSDGRRIVGFADGHAKLLDADSWAKAKAASHIP
jgi:prepilin-type processing-associated H-X9-DG protein